jgi:hypothetical protein
MRFGLCSSAIVSTLTVFVFCGCGETQQLASKPLGAVVDNSVQTSRNPVDALKAIIKPQGTTIIWDEWKRPDGEGVGRGILVADPSSVTFDVKKTDSLVSPFVAECVINAEKYDQYKLNGENDWGPKNLELSYKFKVVFAFQDQKWEQKGVEYICVSNRGQEWRATSSNWTKSAQVDAAVLKALTGKGL